jgi:hypothetical protein
VKVDVIGLHPVEEAEESCHLVEIQVTGDGVFEAGSITQPDDSLPEANWQVPYDEYQLSPDGTSGSALDLARVDVPGTLRLAFFFHHLNTEAPLQTPAGPVRLPMPSPRPARLRFITYEAPR